MKTPKRCAGCKHLKRARVHPKTRILTERYWCGLTEKPDGTALGVYVLMTTPHPKCPLKQKI